MKILLVHPNLFAQRYVSCGIAMISAMLKAHGHQVQFFDASRYSNVPYPQTDLAQEKTMAQILQFKPVELPAIERSCDDVYLALRSCIQQFAPDIVGFSVTSSEYTFACKLLQIVREFDSPVVFGGIHATVCPEQVIMTEGVDYVVIGEGEFAMLELVEHLSCPKDNRNIPNVWMKDNGKVFRNSVRPYNNDLDSLPFPDYEIFDKYHHLGAYQGNVVTYARLEAGRGCPFECSYCINQKLHNIYDFENRHVRRKSIDRIFAEIQYTKDVLNFDIIRFLDETFTAAPVEWLSEFSKRYKREVNKPLILTTRPEHIRIETMQALKPVHGLLQITMGIESGSTKIRREVLNRRMSNESIIRAFNLCHEAGIHTAAFNMIGLPEETREDFMQTIELNRNAKVDTPILSYFYPFPGCPLRSYCIEKGYISNELHQVDYSSKSLMDMPQFSWDEICRLKRTFVLYTKMDKSDYPQIKQAEKDDAVFSELVEKYNNFFSS